MSQIGIPPAGWYTDPSGQHRARYWDGTSWTDQVRDDLTDRVDAGAATASESHPMAATVAGVAEAVAAVAANDLTRPTELGGEPPLVVDLGTDVPWGGAIGSVGSNGDHGSAFAPADPFAVDPFAVDPFAAADPVAASTPFAAAPVDPVAPSTEPTGPTGPVPGWYPDPAVRHHARLWDGARWTDRVADDGIEGFDPLPGMPVAATTVDPAVGAWSTELVDTVGTTDPVGVMGAVGADGQPLTAGQISLASLTGVDDPLAEPRRVPARPTTKVRIAGGFVVAGALALLVGSATTWMEVTGPRVGDEWTATGLDLGDGRITILLGVLLAVLGLAILVGRMFGGTKIAAMGCLVAGAAALAVTAVDIADVADRATRLGVPAGAVSNVGMGLWLAFVGALFAVGGGLMAFANRQ